LDKDPDARFFVISDDIEYCKSYSVLSLANVTFVEGLSPEYSIYLMSLCSKGGICANSSFSWWGSYLIDREKIVILPKKWINNDNENSDLYYEGSIIL